MMKLMILALHFCWIPVIGSDNGKGLSQTIYYSTMIANEVLKARFFVLPTDNRRYFGNKIPDENEARDIGEYDFIIVGSGSSGSVLFHRLAENPDWKILMIEAGGNETDFSDIPSMAFLLQQSQMNWGYKSTSQHKSCLGMIQKQCTYPRGRVVGGSSTINAMMYVRGNKNDFNQWEQQGNPGWSYEKILPYFKKSERFEADDGDYGYHSTTGLWNVTHPKPVAYLTDHFFAANEELGYKYVDYNGRNQMGFSLLQMNLNHGKRASGGRSFIDPIRNKKNVKFIINALATKILINHSNSAYGIIFSENGKLYKATVRKEVIISGGAINSPQLLMLSGIGPKDHLKQMNIPVVQDLPVGKFLQDHPVYIGLNFRTNFTFKMSLITTYIKDFFKGRGVLTYGLSTHGIKFINTRSPKSRVPDVEYIFVPPPSNSDISNQVFNVDPKLKIFENINKRTDFKILLVLLHPKSMGDVTLKSNSPLDFPNINTNYFTDENDEDVETIYRGILHILELVNTTAFRKINAKLHFDINLCNQHEKYSRDYWHCAIRHFTSTLYHSTGTTRMGPNPTNSVVNHELKVHGINNLRVADCGIIPSTTSGHTSAPAFMIGEKIADLLKNVYQ